MKTNKRFTLLVTLVFALTAIMALLGGCKATTPTNQIIGKWELSEDFSSKGIRIPAMIEFFSDGTVQSEWGGKYSIDGNKLNIYYAAMDSYTYTFKIESDTLTLQSDVGPYANDQTEYIYLRGGAEESRSGATETDEGQPKLSASCDYILTSGTSTAGDEYELVLNESKTYDSTQMVGLIKNNQWLIEPTADSPIIDASGSVYAFSMFKADYEQYTSPNWNVNDYPTTYRLVTDDCFLLSNLNEKMLWNFKNGKTFKLSREYGDYRSSFGFEDDTVTSEKLVMLYIVSEFRQNETTWKILDTESMTVVKSFGKDDFYGSVGRFAEGMFYAETWNKDIDGDGNYDKAGGFYDQTGKLVIDLSKYEIEKCEPFSNGKATFIAENKAGTSFKITIDRSGNVLSEEAVA